MKMGSIGWIIVAAVSFSVLPSADAQTLLKKLQDQLEQNLPGATPPARQRVDEPQPNSPQEVLPAPRDGGTPSASRASLGIRIAPVTEEYAREFQLVVRSGALITAIERGSPADRAGLPLGGVIVALDGRRVDSPADLAQAMRGMRPGRDVEVTYYERDRLARKKVHLVSGLAPDLLPPSEDNQPIPSPVPNTPTPPRSPGSSLGQRLGSGGSRPLLGRIGQVLDSVVAPAGALESDPRTVVNRVDSSSEIALLRQQVEQLQKQVDSLQKSIESLEKKLAERK